MLFEKRKMEPVNCRILQKLFRAFNSSHRWQAHNFSLLAEGFIRVTVPAGDRIALEYCPCDVHAVDRGGEEDVEGSRTGVTVLFAPGTLVTLAL